MLRINLLTLRLCPECGEAKPVGEYRKEGSRFCRQCRADYSFMAAGRARAELTYMEWQTFSLAEFRRYRAENGGRCVRCGSQDRVIGDHVIPICLGGPNTLDNIQFLCTTCNNVKGWRIARDYRTCPEGIDVPLPPIERFPCTCRGAVPGYRGLCPRHAHIAKSRRQYRMVDAIA